MDLYSKIAATATSHGGSATEFLASQPWENIMFVTLPIWLPMMALCLFGLTRTVIFKTIVSFGVGVKRVWFAYGAVYTVFCFLPEGTVRKVVSKIPGAEKYLPALPNIQPAEQPVAVPASSEPQEKAPTQENRDWVLPDDELVQFKRRIEGGKEEGVDWEELSNRSTDRVHSISWRHIYPDNSTEYITRSVFQNSKPEDMFAFYGADEFRTKWDKMYNSGEVLETDEETGAESVHWIRDFPGWCSQRDYVFARRSWTEGDKFYTITKGCPNSQRPAMSKPKRVEDYFSAWRVRPVAGKSGEMDAVEVVFMHYENILMQQDCARLAIRLGLWGVMQSLAKGFYIFAEQREAEQLVGKKTPLPASREYKGIVTPSRVHTSDSAASLSRRDTDAECSIETADSLQLGGKRVQPLKNKVARFALGVVCALVMQKGAGKGLRRRARKAQSVQ